MPRLHYLRQLYTTQPPLASGKPASRFQDRRPCTEISRGVAVEHTGTLRADGVCPALLSIRLYGLNQLDVSGPWNGCQDHRRNRTLPFL